MIWIGRAHGFCQEASLSVPQSVWGKLLWIEIMEIAPRATWGLRWKERIVGVHNTNTGVHKSLVYTDTSAHKHRCKHRCTQWGLEWLWQWHFPRKMSAGHGVSLSDVHVHCTLYTLCNQFCLSISHPWDRILPHQESRTFIDFCCQVPQLTCIWMSGADGLGNPTMTFAAPYHDLMICLCLPFFRTLCQTLGGEGLIDEIREVCK